MNKDLASYFLSTGQTRTIAVDYYDIRKRVYGALDPAASSFFLARWGFTSQNSKGNLVGERASLDLLQAVCQSPGNPFNLANNTSYLPSRTDLLDCCYVASGGISFWDAFVVPAYNRLQPLPEKPNPPVIVPPVQTPKPVLPSIDSLTDELCKALRPVLYGFLQVNLGSR